jgi:hypothetical protein
MIHAILKLDGDATQISMIDSNNTVDDILLYDDLNQYAKGHRDQFKVWYTLSHQPEEQDWKYSVGFLDEQMMRDHFFPPDGDKVATFLWVSRCFPLQLLRALTTETFVQVRPTGADRKGCHARPQEHGLRGRQDDVWILTCRYLYQSLFTVSIADEVVTCSTVRFRFLSDSCPNDFK